jgi:hypothetical protein
MPSRTSDFVCALAGLVLVALVFVPWWEYDPQHLTELASAWTVYAPVELAGVSAWHGALGAAIPSIATAALAASLVAVGPARADGLVLLRPAVAAVALVALVATTIRLAGDPPHPGYGPAPVALFGLLLLASIAVSAVAGLRRT